MYQIPTSFPLVAQGAVCRSTKSAWAMRRVADMSPLVINKSIEKGWRFDNPTWFKISKPEFFVIFFSKEVSFSKPPGHEQRWLFSIAFSPCASFHGVIFLRTFWELTLSCQIFKGPFFPKHRLESMLNFPCVYLRDSGSENFSDSRWANIFCTTSLTPLLTRYFRNPSTQGPKLCPLKKVLLKMMFLIPRWDMCSFPGG